MPWTVIARRSRALTIALAIASSLAAIGAPRPAEAVEGARPPEVLYVDVDSAILATRRGKALSEELETARRRFEAEVEPRERALVELQGALGGEPRREDRDRYQEAERELERVLTDEEARLARVETEYLGPLREAAHAAIRRFNETRTNRLVIDMADHPLINPVAECDATRWLSRVLDGAPAKDPRGGSACGVRFFLYVDLERLKHEMKRSQNSVRTLNALRAEREAALAGRSSEGETATRLERFVEYTAGEQKRRKRQRMEEVMLSLAARAFLSRTGSRLPGTMFVESRSGEGRLSPSCDVTPWTIGLDHAKARLEDIGDACPCIWFSTSGKLRVARSCPGR